MKTLFLALSLPRNLRGAHYGTLTMFSEQLYLWCEWRNSFFHVHRSAHVALLKVKMTDLPDMYKGDLKDLGSE